MYKNKLCYITIMLLLDRELSLNFILVNDLTYQFIKILCFQFESNNDSISLVGNLKH